MAEMVAPAVENSSSEMSSNTLFLASNILERYMGRDEDDQTICDSWNKVCGVFFFVYYLLKWYRDGADIIIEKTLASS